MGHARPEGALLSRILALFPALDDAQVGGIETAGRIALDALRSLPQAELSVVTYGPGAVSGRPSPGFRATSTRGGAIAAARKAGRADVIFVWHIHMLKLLPFLRVGGARVIAFLHGIEAWKSHSGVQARALGRVDRWLSNSAFTWQRFVDHAPDQASTPHSIVHLGTGRPVPRPSDAHDPVAVMVGRLPHGRPKGHVEVIRAWPHVMGQISGARLDIVGDGPLRADLAAESERVGVATAVRFAGRVTDAERDRAITDARALLLPSRGEGFGMSYIEAMRLARPCLVSNEDAGREVVAPPEAGLAVDPARERDLVDAIVTLLAASPRRDKLATGAARRYEQNFTEAHFVARLQDALTAD